MAETKLCSVEGCGKRRHVRGLCSTHNWRWKTHGDLYRARRGPLPPRPCGVEGCKKHRAVGRRGWCNAHYIRWYKFGDPETPLKIASRGEPELWMRSHVAYQGEQCLFWPFARTSDGVGRLGRHIEIGDFRTAQAPRAMCALAHGVPPFETAQAAHSCGKGHLGCINPRHLRWRSPAANTREKAAHGTQLRGERHAFSRLSELQVRAVRVLSPQFSAPELAEIFGVHAWTVRNVIDRKTWAWLK